MPTATQDPRTPAPMGARWLDALPDVVAVRPLGDGALHVEFEDGRSGEFDMSPYLAMPAFAGLRDPEAFARARVEGGTVAWPGGADMAPDVLYEGLRETAPDREQGQDGERVA